MKLFSRKPEEGAARDLYESIMSQARAPGFYRDFGVPDSVDGRFEMLLLHSFMVFHRLKGQGEHASRFGQALFDLMVFHLDQSIRLSGVGDLKVGPRLKAMGEAFYGRSQAYETALAEGTADSLKSALSRNVYGSCRDDGSPHPSDAVLAALAGYVRDATQSLAGQPLDELLAGRVTFPALPQHAAPVMSPEARHG